MRIIAGSLRGRTIFSPKGHKTHPMSEKTRGALFNVLGDISGLSVLDAFAGSGALSAEAISRGAASSIAIDNDKNAQTAIAENIKQLQINNQMKLIKANAGSWLTTTSEKYDIVLLDPPYDNFQPSLATKLAARANSNGVVVVSQPGDSKFMLSSDFELLADKDYGDSRLVFYRRIS